MNQTPTSTTNSKTSPSKPNPNPNHNQAEIARLTGEIDTLVERLEKGQELYDKETDPARRERIYQKWLGLLDEYTNLCDKRRALGYVYPSPQV